jgi:hypothetical protein
MKQYQKWTANVSCEIIRIGVYQPMEKGAQ